MGGTPYQSLGCANCRRRKIKCDLAKPECARCVKNGALCLGYVEYRNILHHSLVTRRTPYGNTTRPAHRLVDKLLPHPNELNGKVQVRTQIFSEFMNALFAHNVLSDCKDDNWYILMSHFPSMAGESGLVDRSVIALAATFLANKKGDAQLLRHGVEIYNSAINGLARMLQRDFQPTFDMFYSMIVFHTYELMQTNIEALPNCLAHIQGTTAILEHLDCTNLEQKPFLRAMLIRQKWATTFFALNTKYVFRVHCESLVRRVDNSPLDQLFGIVAECVNLQKSLDHIKKQKDSGQPASYEPLLSYCHEIENKLQDWLTKYAPRLDGGPVSDWNQPKNYPQALPSKSFLEPYRFQSLATGKTYVLFWVISLMVRRILYHTDDLRERAPSPTNMLFCADQICRCVDYCMQPRNRISAAQVILFGISHASQCYIDCADRKKFVWCQEIYPLVSISGFTVVRHLEQEQCNHWNAVHGQAEISQC